MVSPTGRGESGAGDGGKKRERNENAEKCARTHEGSLESRTGRSLGYPPVGRRARVGHALGAHLSQTRDDLLSRMDRCGQNPPSALAVAFAALALEEDGPPPPAVVTIER